MSPRPQPTLRRYAVLWHSGIDEPHFDFLVETGPGSDLATWRLANWPVVEPGEARRLKDHRRLFLDYQGELSGHRGQVEKVAGGECRLEIGEDAVWKVSFDYGTTMEINQVSGDLWRVRVI